MFPSRPRLDYLYTRGEPDFLYGHAKNTIEFGWGSMSFRGEGGGDLPVRDS